MQYMYISNYVFDCIYIIYIYIYKISIGTSKTDLLQNPGRHDQRSPGQLRIPNTQDEFGLDKVRFAQAIQFFAAVVGHREKNDSIGEVIAA